MRSSLSLQRSLYAHQKRQIARLVQSTSPAFRRYERRYHEATRRYRRTLTPREVTERLAEADLVYVGDYHTLRQAQQGYLELVERALGLGRRVVLALEFVEGRSQAHLDAYLAGRLSEKAFLQRIAHPYRGPFDIWPSFRAILEVAKQHRLQVVAIDRRAPGPRSLQVRDRYAAGRLAAVAAADDRPLVLTLVGQFHVAPSHLPRRVAQALGTVKRAPLIVYQNAEGIWWKLAARGKASVPAVEVDATAICLLSASPVVCQRTFLDYVEAETGDAPLDEGGLTRTFALLSRDISRLVGLPPADARAVEVVTAGQLDAFRRLVKRGGFTGREVRALEAHLLSRESAYIPRAKAVWLASLSLNHAAEEAAHFVRASAIGAQQLERPRPRSQAFWARVYEEALGFFGSRLVNPARHCVTLEGWAALFSAKGEQHQAAAFVLAAHAALVEDNPAPGRLVPVGAALFNAASHGLGYLLGDALWAAFEAKAVDRKTLRALFLDPLEQPFLSCLRLRRSTEASARPPRPPA